MPARARSTSTSPGSSGSTLCQTLEISPNDLFGVSARMDGELSQLDSWAMKTALKMQELSPAMRQTVDGLLDALSKR
jgi:hypothetical protein